MKMINRMPPHRVSEATGLRTMAKRTPRSDEPIQFCTTDPRSVRRICWMLLAILAAGIVIDLGYAVLGL